MSDALSPRLSLMLGQGIPGEDFWDFCCDHGLLGAAALRSCSFGKIHFVDRVPHIIEKLRDNLDGEAVILLSGAEDVFTEITGTAFISGVGGHNIIKILASWRERGNLRARRLVLNPLTHIAELRAYLEDFPYVEKQTLIVRESGRDRQILVLEPS